LHSLVKIILQKSDHNKQLNNLTVITLSGIHLTIYFSIVKYLCFFIIFIHIQQTCIHINIHISSSNFQAWMIPATVGQVKLMGQRRKADRFLDQSKTKKICPWLWMSRGGEGGGGRDSSCVLNFWQNSRFTTSSPAETSNVGGISSLPLHSKHVLMLPITIL